MRITNQMLAQTSKKSGIPLQKNTLLDVMNKSASSQDDLFSPVNRKDNTNTYLQKINSKNSKELKNAAEEMSEYASKLCEEGADSLFSKAISSGNTSDVAANITDLTNSYNNTIKYLKSSDSALNKFYMQELQSCISDYADVLKGIGITKNKDGSLTIQTDTLNAADIKSLEKAFGSASNLSEKLGYVGGRVAETASSAASILSGYNSDGSDYWNTFTKNSYDFLR